MDMPPLLLGKTRITLKCVGMYVKNKFLQRDSVS
jgi:hypothetical protein